MRKKQAGFTLIETLIVVFLIGIVLVAGGNMFFGIMKGASKVEVEREIKQNGEYALAIMERMIKNSRSVTSCSSGSLEIENTDHFLTIFHLIPDSGVDRIASSSASAASDLFLTGDNVNVSDFVFTCTTDPVDSLDEDDIRRVDINFTITPKGVIAGEVPPEMYAKIDFQTSVSLRNFER
jgi:prepilin-type N-terminal cleavage/methylation domain-containing protein